VVIKRIQLSRIESEESSFETPACRDMSLGADQLICFDSNGKKGIRRCKEIIMGDLK
jgi:hypothetical protein